MHCKSAFVVALSVLTTFAAACGSDKDSGGNTGGNSGSGGGSSSGGSSSGSGGSGSGMCKTDFPAITTSSADACKAFCQAEMDCKAGTTLEDCLMYRSCDTQDEGPAACVAATKTLWACRNAQGSAICMADKCCESQSDAAFNACP